MLENIFNITISRQICLSINGSAKRINTLMATIDGTHHLRKDIEMTNVKIFVCFLLIILLSGCATRVNTNKFQWHGDLAFQSMSDRVEQEHDLTLSVDLRLNSTPSTAQDLMVQESLRESLVNLLRSQGMFRQIVASGSKSDALLRVDLTYAHSAVDELQKMPLSVITLFIYTPSRVDSTGIAKAIVTSRFSQDSLTDQWHETGKGTTSTGLLGHGDAMAKSIKSLSSKLLPRVSDFIQANSSYFDQILIAKRRQGETPSYAMRPPEISKYAATIPKNPQQRLLPRSAQLHGERWAVVIGVSEYRDSRVPSLRYAARDAIEFYRWLISPQEGRYAPARVKLLVRKDATVRNMRAALFEWLKQAIEEDIVTIFFAGHGSPESQNSADNLYLLPYDVDYNSIASTAFPMWDIETALKRHIKAKRVIVVADACHSGGVGQSFDVAHRAGRGVKVVPMSSGFEKLSSVQEGVCVIMASGDKQLSQEGKQWGGGHGVFTHYLLKGLQGEADYNRDGKTTLGEMVPYLSQQVRRATKNAQCPIVAGKFDPALAIGK
jgi:hypothetical protein